MTSRGEDAALWFDFEDEHENDDEDDEDKMIRLPLASWRLCERTFFPERAWERAWGAWGHISTINIIQFLHDLS